MLIPIALGHHHHYHQPAKQSSIKEDRVTGSVAQPDLTLVVKH